MFLLSRRWTRWNPKSRTFPWQHKDLWIWPQSSPIIPPPAFIAGPALNRLSIGANMGIFSLEPLWWPDRGQSCERKMKIRWCWSVASISNKTAPLANCIDLEEKKGGINGCGGCWFCLSKYHWVFSQETRRSEAELPTDSLSGDHFSPEPLKPQSS